jgi:thiol-disulfide isomerase/thioredoxin
MKALPHSIVTASLAILIAASALHAQSPTPAPSATPGETGTAAQPAPDFSQYKTADDLWAQIQKWEQGPGAPSATPDQVLGLLRQLTGGATEFQTRYPKDPRRWEARLIVLQYGSMLQSASSEQPDPAKIESELKTVAAGADAPDDVKAEARINLIGLHASGQDTVSPDLEKEILAFLHDFPKDPDGAQLQKMRLKSLETTDPAAAGKLLDALLKDPNPAIADMAKSEVQMRDLMKKPLELQFTAADGTKVDIQKLRGKVVLIDFWATWCAPCMEEVPNTVKLFKDYHAKGLEVIGISLDQDNGVMKGVTQSSGMTWPQYFDGKGWENAISSRYGITQIPTMWLVNKKGMVVDTSALDGLEDKVKKLLTE